MKKLLFILFLYCVTLSVSAQLQQQPELPLKNGTQAAGLKWFDRFAIRGYTQGRYNRLMETNPNLKCEQCDRSWGDGGGFFIRRMRIIFFGQISEKVYFYVQPDFASSVGTTQHIAQLRDAYMDLGFDKKNEFRIRVGQSKVPFGFENMQSSQNRIPLDRADALNSAVTNERDLGAFFYWAPESVRKLYTSLVNDGLKGSGDYGVFAFGAYNGQTANQPERNNQPHIVTRFSYPIRIGNQIIEPGIQAYSGKFVLLSTSNGVKRAANNEYLDQRAAMTFVLYPKPFGIQAEYNIGRGPEFNKLTDSIELRSLTGGYFQCYYMIRKGNQTFLPFTRAQYYEGGKKHELDARSYTVRELEVGLEWQPAKTLELVAMYTFSDRRFEDFVLQNNRQKGRLLRLQVQINF